MTAGELLALRKRETDRKLPGRKGFRLVGCLLFFGFGPLLDRF